MANTPAAKAALRGLKFYLPYPQPKGILLESMTWRVAKARRCLRGTCRKYDALALFVDVAQELASWKNSHFGHDLKKDLSNLSHRQSEKYTSGLTTMHGIGFHYVTFQLLRSCYEDLYVCHCENYWTNKLPKDRKAHILAFFTVFWKRTLASPSYFLGLGPVQDCGRNQWNVGRLLREELLHICQQHFAKHVVGFNRLLWLAQGCGVWLNSRFRVFLLDTANDDLGFGFYVNC